MDASWQATRLLFIAYCWTTTPVSVAVAPAMMLQVGHNQLQRLPACVGQLTALTHLGLEGNALQQIEPGALEGLARLEVLQLQDNQLQQLPTGLGGRGVGCGCTTVGGAKHQTVHCNCLWGLPMECYWLQGSFLTWHWLLTPTSRLLNCTG